MVVNLAAVALCNFHLFAAWLFDEGSVGWDPISLWKQMGLLAKVVVIILFIMSGWSIGVMIDRWMAFNAARNQSRSFAPAVAGAAADCEGVGQGGCAASQAPCRARPTRQPRPSHLSRHVRRPRHESEGVAETRTC